MLQKVLERENTPYLWVGTVAGVIGGIAQMVGLLRWTFVVPVLAKTFTDPSASDMAKETAVIVFQTVHQYGGIVVGEHTGQAFSIIWMFIISLVIFKSNIFKRWLAWFGFLASGVYILAQTELFATVIPNFPVVPAAGLIGSLLWLVWMIALGVVLERSKIIKAQ